MKEGEVWLTVGDRRGRSSRRTFECLRETANGSHWIGRFRRASTDNARFSRGAQLETWDLRLTVARAHLISFPSFSSLSAFDWQRIEPDLLPARRRHVASSSSSYFIIQVMRRRSRELLRISEGKLAASVIGNWFLSLGWYFGPGALA